MDRTELVSSRDPSLAEVDEIVQDLEIFWFHRLHFEDRIGRGCGIITVVIGLLSIDAQIQSIDDVQDRIDHLIVQ